MLLLASPVYRPFLALATPATTPLAATDGCLVVLLIVLVLLSTEEDGENRTRKQDTGDEAERDDDRDFRMEAEVEDELDGDEEEDEADRLIHVLQVRNELWNGDSRLDITIYGQYS